ncbi:hypothetical protein ACPXBB_26600, partial [Escherichia coli]|uniref:hypothetical protein n=1 Tax=Escherichia coli TaxID=562 RepID=UPI003CE7561C
WGVPSACPYLADRSTIPFQLPFGGKPENLLDQSFIESQARAHLTLMSNQTLRFGTSVPLDQYFNEVGQITK